MTFQCQDLKDAGVVLVPPSSPDYDPLLADIRRRMAPPAEIPGTLEELHRMLADIPGGVMPAQRPEVPVQVRQKMKEIAGRMAATAAPPGAPDPQMMLANISPGKRSSSAILLNQSDKSIAALSLVWR